MPLQRFTVIGSHSRFEDDDDDDDDDDAKADKITTTKDMHVSRICRHLGDILEEE